MKRILSALVTLVLLASPVMAESNVRSVLYGSGDTEINQLSSIGGFDSTQCSMQVTAFIHEGLKNDGQLYFVNEITTPGSWEMVEEKYIEGTGDTKIKKEVVWWTEDSRVVDGAMLYPTVTNIFTGFYTGTFVDEVEIHNTADEPVEDPYNPGQYSTNYFLKVWDTDDDFTFTEGVGINLPSECSPHEPHSWRFPRCEKC